MRSKNTDFPVAHPEMLQLTPVALETHAWSQDPSHHQLSGDAIDIHAMHQNQHFPPLRDGSD